MANKATTLKGTNRTRLGKGASRQARRDGLVPAVVYGHGSEPRHVVLDEHATASPCAPTRTPSSSSTSRARPCSC